MARIERERWRILEPLLDRALELSPDEYAAWLGELRAESPALGAELVSLLAQEGGASRCSSAYSAAKSASDALTLPVSA